MSRVFQASRSLMAAAKSAAKMASSTPATAKNSGIMKPQLVSPAMEKFVGASSISRTEAVKKIWEYVKLHQLQNPANRKEINCDDNLKSILDGREKVGMLEISKLISPHFIKS